MESILICSRALGVAFDRKSELKPRPVPWGLTTDEDAWYRCVNCPKPLSEQSGASLGPGACLVLGGPRTLAEELQKSLLGAEWAPVYGAAVEAALKRTTKDHVVVFAEPLLTCVEDCTAQGPTMAALLRSIQLLAVAQEHPRVVVLTAGAQEADVNREMGLGRGLMGSAAWGFMRSIPLEAPQLRTRVIDLPGPLVSA